MGGSVRICGDLQASFLQLLERAEQPRFLIGWELNAKNASELAAPVSPCGFPASFPRVP